MMKALRKKTTKRHKGIFRKTAAGLLLVLTLLLGTACGDSQSGEAQTKTDDKGFYSYDGYVVKSDYPLDEDSVKKAAGKLNRIYEMYLEGKNVKTYYSIVPDKNYCIGEEAGMDTIDYDKLAEIMATETKQMEYIDITDLPGITDYYKTDAHWRQESIQDVADRLAEGMGVSLCTTYETKTAAEGFTGAYGRQSDLEMEPEALNYLQNEILDSCKVTDYETGNTIPVYDLSKATSNEGEGYDMFLGGAKSLITVENPNCKSGRELVMFRDSFASSLAPLFAEGYSKITLVDIRYLPTEMVGRFVTFDSQDVLFLYSIPVLNNSVTMK